MRTDKGVDIDPATLQPRERQAEQNTRLEQKAKDALLSDQASWLKITQSEAGEKLLALIQERFTACVKALVDADPAASTYKKLLQDMGIRMGIAETAAMELTRRYLRQKEDG